MIAPQVRADPGRSRVRRGLVPAGGRRGQARRDRRGPAVRAGNGHQDLHAVGRQKVTCLQKWGL